MRKVRWVVERWVGKLYVYDYEKQKQATEKRKDIGMKKKT